MFIQVNKTKLGSKNYDDYFILSNLQLWNDQLLNFEDCESVALNKIIPCKKKLSKNIDEDNPSTAKEKFDIMKKFVQMKQNITIPDYIFSFQDFYFKFFCESRQIKEEFWLWFAEDENLDEIEKEYQKIYGFHEEDQLFKLPKTKKDFEKLI